MAPLSTAIGLPGTAPARGAQTCGYDLLLKGGHVIDPGNHIDGLMDVAVSGGKLNPAIVEARKRGVYFDLGHASASFWWRNAAPAIQQGFQPDSTSTDIHHGNLPQFVVSNNNVASKCLAMGESLNDAIRQLTVNPAREIRRPELGTLSVESVADIAVLDLMHGNFSYAG